MPKCSICSKNAGHDIFYPPDMVDDPLETGEHKGERICHFCKYGTDKLVGTDGTIYEKQAVLKDYQDFLNDVYHRPAIFKAFSKSIVDSAVAKINKK